MCDCEEYMYEEIEIETEAKEPERVAVPIQVARSKKK
jgi:hypothetical protein